MGFWYYSDAQTVNTVSVAFFHVGDIFVYGMVKYALINVTSNPQTHSIS